MPGALVDAGDKPAWVSKFQLPLTAEAAKDLAEYVKKAPDAELSRLGLLAAPRPRQTIHLENADIHAYISGLQYNHTAANYFNLSKRRPYCLLMHTAKEMVKDALPIKCVEAVFLALLLTSSWHDLHRVPLGFKTRATPWAQTNGGRVYRHLVLAVMHKPSGKWGALGLSRRAQLMDKPMEHSTFTSLLQDYRQAYHRWWHEVLKLRIGLPAPHDAASGEMVCWRRCCLTVPDQDWEDISCRIEEHVASFSRRSASLPNLSIESGLTSPPKADKDQQDAKAVIQPDVLS
eukprot:jgi/Astpho2/6202/Aster-x1355